MIALGIKNPDWDVRSDIWSLACTVSLLSLIDTLINFMWEIYEIVAGGTFFYGVGARGLLNRMAQTVGQLPPLWASYWASNEHLTCEGTGARLFHRRRVSSILLSQTSRLQEQTQSGWTTGQPLYGVVGLKRRLTVC
jgi:hypothetical protein